MSAPSPPRRPDRARLRPLGRPLSRPLLRALLVLLGLLAPGSGTSWAAATHEHSGTHQCACGTGCRGSCCCARRQATRSEPATPPAVNRSQTQAPPQASPVRSGPCLAAAPCGLPDSPAPSPRLQGRVLDRPPAVPQPIAPEAGALVETRSVPARPARAPEPPVRPPERTDRV